MIKPFIKKLLIRGLQFNLFIFMFFSNETLANVYYVSPYGSDYDNGSISSPFKTIQKAANIVNPGDTVIVRDGIYTDSNNDNSVVDLDRGGTSTDWITFKSENMWGAVLDGQNNNTKFGWWLRSNANYVRIEKFEIKGCIWGGIWSNERAHHVYIKSNNINNIGRRIYSGKYGQSGVFQGKGTSHYTYDSNVFHHIGRLPSESSHDYNHDHGIYPIGEHVTIVNNLFYELKAGWGIQLSGAYGDSCGNFYIIANNTFSGSNPGRKGQLILWGSCHDILIQNNIFLNPNSEAIVGNDCEGKFSITIRNNITNVDIIYDDCYAQILSNITNSNIKLIDATNYNFRISAVSPARNAGINMIDFAWDIDGNERTQDDFWDIGAYEFVGKLPTTVENIKIKK